MNVYDSEFFNQISHLGNWSFGRNCAGTAVQVVFYYIQNGQIEQIGLCYAPEFLPILPDQDPVLRAKVISQVKICKLHLIDYVLWEWQRKILGSRVGLCELLQRVRGQLHISQHINDAEEG